MRLYIFFIVITLMSVFIFFFVIWIVGNPSKFRIMTTGHYFSVILQKLEYPKVKGQLVIFGATNWDLIGRKEVPKQSGIIQLSFVCFFLHFSYWIYSAVSIG